MYNNENLPELFREIFKNSFLPFKDPSTLNMFLKEINEFNYSHSEKLGDAFEYLLSFMGSQGDAGQFRTPRHIIDFIVEIVNPQKKETILDPACGTAGFLISSYKHILKQNTKKNLGDLLNASDRKKIGENLNGYDISPDMVKMSLVNMYLHKFTSPNISEYDTLSSEDKWNEYYNVILANPPFFSPKGGITPHNRFGVKSTKAEVLFVDYINEHLKPNGRAGIIVPEGIIFQSGISYKQLRKRLIETSLIGIVSLPAGVFQPYSGVKTSILILDKELSKKTKHIFFIDIQNDGYSLNVNRYEINNNDLPDAILNIKGNKNLNKIEKIKILNSDDISLTSLKYSEEAINKNLEFTRTKISEVADIFSGSRQKGGSLDEGIPSIGGAQIDKNGNILNNKMVFISKEHFNSMKKGHLQKGDVLIVKDGATTGKMGFYKGEFLEAAINEHIFALRTKENYNNYFLYYLLKSNEFQKKLKPFIQGIIGGINLKFSNIEIPFPPLENQNQIIEELNGYQKIIDGCRQVIENYKPIINIDPSWEIVEIGNLVMSSKLGLVRSSKEINNLERTNYIKMNNITYWGELDLNKIVKVKVNQKELEEHGIKKGDFLFNTRNTPELVGKCCVVEKDLTNTTFNNNILRLRLKKNYLPEFLNLVLNQNIYKKELKRFVNATTSVAAIYQKNFFSIKVPIPSLEIQKEIVLNYKKEKEILNSNKIFENNYKEKINNKIDLIWSS